MRFVLFLSALLGGSLPLMGMEQGEEKSPGVPVGSGGNLSQRAQWEKERQERLEKRKADEEAQKIAQILNNPSEKEEEASPGEKGETVLEKLQRERKEELQRKLKIQREQEEKEKEDLARSFREKYREDLEGYKLLSERGEEFCSGIKELMEDIETRFCVQN
jgi:hypothetical protein